MPDLSPVMKRLVEGVHRGSTVAKAAKATLYARRPLINGDELISWAKGQGFGETLTAEDMHVTVAFSKTPVRWQKIGEDWSDKPEYDYPPGLAGLGPAMPWRAEDPAGSLRASGGPREVKRLGDKGAVVLCFDSIALIERWCAFRRAGCSWDYPSYAPHVTITYKAPAKMDVAKVEPFTGDLVFGEEVWEPVKLDWDKTVAHA